MGNQDGQEHGGEGGADGGHVISKETNIVRTIRRIKSIKYIYKYYVKICFLLLIFAMASIWSRQNAGSKNQKKTMVSYACKLPGPTVLLILMSMVYCSILIK